MRLLFVIYLVSTLSILSQPKLDSLVAAGNEQSFQFNFLEANQTFSLVKEEFPNSPLGYYFLSRNNLWFYLANKDSLSKNNFIKYSEIAKAKAESEYDNDPENSLTNFNLGNIYLLESIFSSTEQNTMDAFWATKSAVNYFEESIEYDEKFSEPYLGLGTIKYALGFVPGFLGWAISVAGLDGEKSEGLNDILYAYENSELSKVEASYHLGKIYTEYNAEYDKAEKHLSDLVDNYPNNELFIYQYAILQIDKRNLIKAREYLNKIVLNNLEPKFHQTFALSIFLMGEVSFKENNFEEAIRNYENFIKVSTSIDYTGIANFKMALSYKMLNDDLLANKHFILARNGNQNIAEDSYAAEMSEIYFNKRFSDNEKDIIMAENNLESGNYNSAVEKVMGITIEKNNFEFYLRKELIKIESFQLSNNFEKSGEILSSYNDLSIFSDTQNIAKLYYLKSLQELNDGKFSEAEEYLDLSYDELNKHDNKLNRLLVNLTSKLELAE